jgi:hypothetical protein
MFRLRLKRQKLLDPQDKQNPNLSLKEIIQRNQLKLQLEKANQEKEQRAKLSVGKIQDQSQQRRSLKEDLQEKMLKQRKI